MPNGIRLIFIPVMKLGSWVCWNLKDTCTACCVFHMYYKECITPSLYTCSQSWHRVTKDCSHLLRHVCCIILTGSLNRIWLKIELYPATSDEAMDLLAVLRSLLYESLYIGVVFQFCVWLYSLLALVYWVVVLAGMCLSVCVLQKNKKKLSPVCLRSIWTMC